MITHIDVSGQVQQKNYDSAIGFARSDGITNSVFLKKEVKREIIGEYKGQITSVIEKVHCILIYYCIRDHLENVREIKICKDCNPRKIRFFLPFLFRDDPHFKGIKIAFRRKREPKSGAHTIALRTHREKKYASHLLDKKDLKSKLFLFK